MRLAIVEDERHLLDSLSMILGGERGISIVGAYSSAEEAIANYKEASPNIMIVDLKLPEMSGVEFIKIAKAGLPGVDILVHTSFDEPKHLIPAIKAGATGYILKGCRPIELVEAIYDLHNGGAPMTPSIARAVIAAFQNDDIEPSCSLTKRERDILKEIDAGQNFKEVARKLHLSPHTVRTHIRNIYEKLHVKSKREALIKAHKTGLL